MSAFKASLEVSYDSSEEEAFLITFTQVLPEKVDNRFPYWPWPDIVYALGFYDDVVGLVSREIKQFRDAYLRLDVEYPRVVLKFNRSQTLPPSDDHLRCANAWVKINKDLVFKKLTIELHRVPGTYKDFVLLDVFDHLEGRAGRGKNRHVDGRPGVLRQKLERALQHGPYSLYDRAFRPEPIPDEEHVRTRTTDED